MTAEIICVGTEILLGNIVNTNAAYLSRKCADLGLDMYFQSVIGDNSERLMEVLTEAMERSQVIILSGGLGPTADDLTKETAAKCMGRKLVRDEMAYEKLLECFRRLNTQMTDNNLKQADVPEKSLVLYNENGTAPGIIMEDENNIIVLLPGPPGELIPMFETYVQPFFEKRQKHILYSVMMKLCGIGESLAEMQIKDLIETQTNPTIATYAKTGEVHLRITAQAESTDDAKALGQPLIEELEKRFAGHIFTLKEEESLEEAIGALLREKKLTITTAESCTGGLVAGRLVNASGISEVFKEGYIVYSNEAKEKLLNVSHQTLETVGAVSRETAEQMALGAAQAAGADVAISITGVAGPNASESKPAGLVYMGCAYKGAVQTRKFQFYGNRSQIRERSVAQALTFIWQTCQDNQAND